MTLQAQGFREQVRRFEDGLDPLDPRERRMVRVLVGQLAGSWIGLHGPSHRTLMAEVARSPSMLRVDAFSEPAIDDPAFWEDLVNRSAEVAIAPWVIDRRRASGLWFELAWDGERWIGAPA